MIVIVVRNISVKNVLRNLQLNLLFMTWLHSSACIVDILAGSITIYIVHIDICQKYNLLFINSYSGRLKTGVNMNICSEIPEKEPMHMEETAHESISDCQSMEGTDVRYGVACSESSDSDDYCKFSKL